LKLSRLLQQGDNIGIGRRRSNCSGAGKNADQTHRHYLRRNPLNSHRLSKTIQLTAKRGQELFRGGDDAGGIIASYCLRAFSASSRSRGIAAAHLAVPGNQSAYQPSRSSFAMIASAAQIADGSPGGGAGSIFGKRLRSYNAPQFSIHYFQVGIDTAGNPLASWGSTTLLCELQRIAPGQSILIVVGGS
jgi:hypothetical protein